MTAALVKYYLCAPAHPCNIICTATSWVGLAKDSLSYHPGAWKAAHTHTNLVTTSDAATTEGVLALARPTPTVYDTAMTRTTRENCMNTAATLIIYRGRTILRIVLLWPSPPGFDEEGRMKCVWAYFDNDGHNSTEPSRTSLICRK